MRFTIGQMAKINNISVQTLRLYDRLLLLRPDYVDPESGYRYYSIVQCAKLDMIQTMKALGMSLKEIREFLDHKNTLFLEEKLREESENIELQLLELEERKMSINQTLASIEQFKNAPPDKTITLEYIPKRTVLVFDSGINYFDYGIDIYEEILLHLKEKLSQLKKDKLYYHNPGTILRRENLEKGEFKATEIFVNVNPKDFQAKQTSVISAGMYQCIYCDSFSKEKEYARLLLDAILKNEYTICGDYICETIAEIPVYKDGERGMYLRLQVPVQINSTLKS